MSLEIPDQNLPKEELATTPASSEALYTTESLYGDIGWAYEKLRSPSQKSWDEIKDDDGTGITPEIHALLTAAQEQAEKEIALYTTETVFPPGTGAVYDQIREGSGRSWDEIKDDNGTGITPIERQILDDASRQLGGQE